MRRSGVRLGLTLGEQQSALVRACRGAAAGELGLLVYSANRRFCWTSACRCSPVSRAAQQRVELVKESPGTPDAPADSEAPPTPPGLSAPLRPWPGLDHLGAIPGRRTADEADRERNRVAVDEVGRRPRRENARERALSALIKQHCFPPESSSTPPQPTEPDCGPSLP